MNSRESNWKVATRRANVLEVGCADAFGARIVQQTVGKVTAVDLDPLFIDDVHEQMDPHWHFEAHVHDMLEGGPVAGKFDAVYALDVLEHMRPDQEDIFLKNVVGSITGSGVAILGMPSLESQLYASPQGNAGHVNCKSGPDLKTTMEKLFNAVFVFSMNDEVVHTGFYHGALSARRLLTQSRSPERCGQTD